MTDLESDGRPFKLVEHQKKSKKPCMDTEVQSDAQYQFKMAFRIIFQKHPKSSM